MVRGRVGYGIGTRNSANSTEIYISLESKDLEHVMKMKDTERMRDTK